MIRRISEMVFNLTTMCIAVVVLSSWLIASYQLETWPWVENLPFRARYEFRTVSRATLLPNLSAPGRVESSRRTIVRCQLENLAGSSSTSGGASTILWLIPEGTPVKKGDILARLDSSTYDEMLRQQTIVVEQARSTHLQARLDYEIAQLAVKEYSEGTVQETVQQMEGNLAMARSDLSRAQQRLDWTKMMNKKGYSSVAQIETDKQTVTSSELALQRQVGSYDLFMRFTKPKTQKTLQGDVTAAQTTLANEYVRLQRQLERYELLKKQVERCTIVAPQDGMIYYYKNPNSRGGMNSQNVPLEEGLAVRQKQELFYLPDLTDMEIQMALNESVVSRISPGMRAKVRFEALPNVVLEGSVSSVNQIPVQQSDRGEDIRYFQSIVKLDRSGEGLKPGMTAQVEIELGPRENVLAVPHEAVVLEHNRKVCYVPRADHLEPREVKVGQGTTEWIEVTEGLAEGEEVALNPPNQGGHPQSLSGFDDSTPWPSIDYSKIAASPRSGGRGEASAGQGGERRKGRRNPGDPARKSRKRAASGNDDPSE
ncbi:MAG: efflux RND transporter periplasmic adaptor subunit [Isosphaeraceae bacterium]